MAFEPGQQAQQPRQAQQAQQAQHAAQAQQGQYAPPPNPTSPIQAQPEHQAAAAKKSLLSTLFDFSFATSATPAITRMLYMLGVVAILISALVWLVIDFRLNTGLGILTLIIFAPLMTIIDIAFLRLVLELFVHVHELANDAREARAERERGYRG